jgi:hypothetical protein
MKLPAGDNPIPHGEGLGALGTANDWRNIALLRGLPTV